MKNLCPQIYRQRMFVEGLYGDCEMTYTFLGNYLKRLSKLIGMTIIHGPLVMRQAEKIYPQHAGFEAVMIWAESGVNLYTWENCKFFTVDLYSCKKFSAEMVVDFTRKYFKADKLYYRNVR